MRLAISHALAAFMAASLRVSASARRVAAAYGDANVLPKRAKIHDVMPFPTCTKKTPRTKKTRFRENHIGTFRLDFAGRVGLQDVP